MHGSHVTRSIVHVTLYPFLSHQDFLYRDTVQQALGESKIHSQSLNYLKVEFVL